MSPRWPHRSLLLAALALPGCQDLPFDDSARLPELLPDLTVGVSTRGELLLQLGLPVETFENDRILAWRVVESVNGPIRLVSQFASPYYSDALPNGLRYAELEPRVRVLPDEVASLIVVFDAQGRVAKARLLRQR